MGKRPQIWWGRSPRASDVWPWSFLFGFVEVVEGFSSARFRRIPSKAPSYPSGLTCLHGVRLGDFIFGQRLAVTILTAASGTQEFPAVGDIALDEFLNLLDMGGADNLVIGELLHSRRRLPAGRSLGHCKGSNPSVASSTSNPKISQIHTERDESASRKVPCSASRLLP